MRPVNSQLLVNYGESFGRIGPTKRAKPFSEYETIERLIVKHATLPASADISPNHPPFFTEFTYTDLLGGMLIRSFSAEINHRIDSKRNLEKESYSKELLEAFNAGLTDKYSLKHEKTYDHKRVVFLCGHNIFDRIIDSQKLFQIMDSDKSVMIKPHPITNDILLRNLGNNFGYGRIIDKDASGFGVMDGCDEVITPNTSELAIVSTLLGKKFTDITNYMQSWMGIASSISRFGYESKDRVLKLLLGENSGFLHPSMSEEEIVSRINNYCALAMKERECFEMITAQRLSVNMPKVIEVPRPPEKEQPK